MASNFKMDNGSRLTKIGHEAFQMLEDNESRLVNIGCEAFQMLEEEGYGRKGRSAAASRQKAPACLYQYQPQKPLVYQMKNPVSSSEEMVTRYDATKLQDGMLVMDCSRRKSAAVAY